MMRSWRGRKKCWGGGGGGGARLAPSLPFCCAVHAAARHALGTTCEHPVIKCVNCNVHASREPRARRELTHAVWADCQSSASSPQSSTSANPMRSPVSSCSVTTRCRTREPMSARGRSQGKKERHTISCPDLGSTKYPDGPALKAAPPWNRSVTVGNASASAAALPVRVSASRPALRSGWVRRAAHARLRSHPPGWRHGVMRMHQAQAHPPLPTGPKRSAPASGCFSVRHLLDVPPRRRRRRDELLQPRPGRLWQLGVSGPTVHDGRAILRRGTTAAIAAAAAAIAAEAVAHVELAGDGAAAGTLHLHARQPHRPLRVRVGQQGRPLRL